MHVHGSSKEEGLGPVSTVSQGQSQGVSVLIGRQTTVRRALLGATIPLHRGLCWSLVKKGFVHGDSSRKEKKLSKQVTFR